MVSYGEDQSGSGSSQFEIARQLRADEFVRWVGLLSLAEYTDDQGDPVTGGEYELSGNSRIAVEQGVGAHSHHLRSTVKLSRPWIEIAGSQDGQLRRARLTRVCLCYSVDESIPRDEVIVAEPEDPPTVPPIGAATRAWLAFMDATGAMERPEGPSELIRGRTLVEVERKLPHSPNYTTEQPTSGMLPAAREAVGEPPIDPLYTQEEHAVLMGILRAIDPRTQLL